VTVTRGTLRKNLTVFYRRGQTRALRARRSGTHASSRCVGFGEIKSAEIRGRFCTLVCPSEWPQSTTCGKIASVICARLILRTEPRCLSDAFLSGLNVRRSGTNCAARRNGPGAGLTDVARKNAATKSAARRNSTAPGNLRSVRDPTSTSAQSLVAETQREGEGICKSGQLTLRSHIPA
jgi:hypothetical protein